MSKQITRDIVVTRVFDAPVERVQKAWADAEQVKRWWGPTDFTSPSAKIDFREGGRSLVCMRSPQGQDMWMTWDYKKIEPLQRFEFVQNLSDKDGNLADPVKMGLPPEFPRDVYTVVTFKAVGGKTEMTITERTHTSEMMLDMSKMGLEQSMDKMAATFAA